MQWIKYQIVQSIIDEETILIEKKVGYSEANLAIAQAEAYNGDYTIEEDGTVLNKEPIAIEFGGTGAKTAEDALNKLGAMSNKNGSVTLEKLAKEVTANALGGATLDAHRRVKANEASTFRVDISASSTLTLEHAGRFILVNSSSPVTITVPTDADVGWDDYTEIEFCQWGSGSVTIEGASGVGIVSMDGAKTIAGQYGCCCLKKTGGSTWILAGALA